MTCGLVLWRYLGNIMGTCFPPVWVSKGALGCRQACSSLLPQTHVNPCGASCCVWQLFSIHLGKTKSFSKKPRKLINKMKIHWASKRELRAFYGKEVNCFRKKWTLSEGKRPGSCRACVGATFTDYPLGWAFPPAQVKEDLLLGSWSCGKSHMQIDMFAEANIEAFTAFQK